MTEYTTCPSCNRDRPTLGVYINNVKCHACGYYSREHELLTQHGLPTAKTMTTKPIEMPTVESFDWTSKCIPADVLDLYGVGIDVNGKVVSPHYSPDMQLLGYHTRTPGERDFRMNGNNTPIGLHTIGRSRELIICEGHSDTYSAKTLFPSCDVIGIPGSDTVATLVPYMTRLRKYRRITIMTDGDNAGRTCADNLVRVLPKSKTYRAHLADGTDVGDYLVNGKRDEIHNLYNLATANKGGRFVSDEDCDKYATSTVYDLISTGIPGLDSLMGGGFNVAELSLLAGYTGTGKSALAQQIAVNVAKSGTKVMFIAGEMTPKQNLDRLVKQWYGGLIRKEDLAACYKEVASSILITKFSDLTLSNVTDTVHEGVLDHGVRLIVVDVLSDIEGFLHTDMTSPAKVIKGLHSATLGSDYDDVPPCALLCVAHTKGSDDGKIKVDDIRGGSVIRQEASGGIYSITEESQGDMTNTNRVLNVIKRPRHRDTEATPVPLTYDKSSQRYTEREQHGIQDSKNLRQRVRREVSPSTPSPSVPPKGVIPVGNQTETETVRVTNELSDSSTEVTTNSTSESVSPGLLLPSNGDVHRDKGNTTDGRQDEVTAGHIATPVNTVQVSSPDVTQSEHGGVNTTTTDTKPSGGHSKLNALRNMYERNEQLLQRHRTTGYKTNDIIRDNLTALGYELL
jgi:5S rRNA maturation endonuclease (ribonuclease M5)